SDGNARLWVRLFHFSMAQQQRLVAGAWLRLFGEVRAGLYGPEMVHPEYRIVDNRAEGEAFTPEVRPVYPTTDGLSQTRLRRTIDQALALLQEADFWPEHMPQSLQDAVDGWRASRALWCRHRPGPDIALHALVDGNHPAVARLACRSLLGQQLALHTRRRRIRQAYAPALAAAAAVERLQRQLGFEPTHAQHRVIEEILHDMAQQTPMLRLLQGDVGSGKTVVAAAAAVVAASSGWQTAFMAPTELLAEQHHASLLQWLEPLAVPVWLLTGRNGQDSDALAALEAGTPGVVVGTHALFQDATRIGRLGLCVIDEQHRFGVDQRLALRNKAHDAGVVTHQLIM